jgi:hypothetical protein
MSAPGFWRAWVELWDRREPPTALALVRIAIGLCVMVDLLQVRWLGLVEAVWAPPPFGLGYGGSDKHWAVDWFGESRQTAQLMWWLAFGSIALFTAGAATRLTGALFVLVYAQLGYISPDSDRGIDIAARVFVGILVFSSCHARWSVDAWVRRRIGRPFPDEIPAWPRYLLLFQLLWIYFSGGHNKSGPEWSFPGGFTALANVMSDPHIARFESGWVSTMSPLLRVATFATMLFELSAPAMLLWTWLSATRDRPGRFRHWVNRLRLRWGWIALGVGFHLGIAVFMKLGMFPWGMLAIYPVLFHPGELVAAEAWLRRRLGRT